MKHIMKINGWSIILLLNVLLIGCSAEDGAIGPQGEQGPVGPTGPVGQDGNSGVIVSEWFGPDGQIGINNSYTIYAEFERNIVDVPPNILDTGTVLVYARLDGFVPEVWPAGHVTQLPITISTRIQNHHFTYYFSDNTLKIRYRQDPLEEDLFPVDSRFRYVIIPPGNSRSMIGQRRDFRNMSYYEVMKHFGVKSTE